MGELSGKVALVTGGGSGIGRACVQLLAQRGATVAFCDLDAAAVAAVASLDQAALDQAALDQAAPAVAGQVADVTDEQSMGRFVDGVAQRFGRLDIVVTAAGVQRYGTAAQTSEQDWNTVFAVNVTGCFLPVKHALPHLRSTRGSVVLVSSVQAFVAQNNAAAYVSSKAAINALARSIAVDEAAHGVRANVVCPGSVDTPMLRASARQFSDGTDAGTQRLIERWGAIHPLGRVARPREVAEAVVFLASERASFITGASLAVDGGLVASVAVAAEPV